MRVLPNRTKSNGSSERVRRGPHAKTHLVWQILLGSLILDPLIPLITTVRIPFDLATTLATWCAIGTLPFLAQDRVHQTLSKLRLLHKKSLDVGSKTIPLSLALSAGAVVLFKILMFADLPPAVLGVLALVILWASRRYLSQIRTQNAQDRELFASNPWAKVERWEHQVIVFALLPLIFARAIAWCGDLADLSSEDENCRLIFLAISALFLGMLRPDRSFFVGVCKACKHPVPIVFQDIGSCLSCDARLRLAYHAWVHRLPIEQVLGHPHSRSENQETSQPKMNRLKEKR
ncbi:MAG: hypothetical protein RL518_2812 [Pseudomonadota bacterium]